MTETFRQGFGILIWKHVGTQKISTQSSKLGVSCRSLYASPDDRMNNENIRAIWDSTLNSVNLTGYHQSLSLLGTKIYFMVHLCPMNISHANCFSIRIFSSIWQQRLNLNDTLKLDVDLRRNDDAIKIAYLMNQ